MDIIAKLEKYLAGLAKTYCLSPAPQPSTKTEAVKALPEHLASKDQVVGDNYEHKKKEENNVYKEEANANKKALRSKYNVKRYENGWYCVKNFFRDQDIISKLERKNAINEGADIKKIKTAARQYLRDEIGIGKGFSKEKLQENYDKVTKQFILDITHLPEEQKNELIEVYAAVIGELSVDIRADLAKDFVSVAESDAETQCIAKSLAMNAEYNVTNKDAFGRFMKQTDAVDYQRTAFANMNKDGIKETLYSMSNRADEVETRLKALRAKSVLTSDEAEELSNLELVKTNYINCGGAAALTGVPANRYVDNEFVNTCLQKVYERARELGILDDVLDLAREYLKKHPEAAQEIINRRNADFETLLKKAMLNRPEVWTANKKNSVQSAKGTGHAQTEAGIGLRAEQSYSQGGVVTDPVMTSSESRLLAGCKNMPSKVDNKKYFKNKASSTYRTGEHDGGSVQSEKLASAECKKAMQAGVEEYLEYEKENKIGLIESCVNILNYSQADKNLKDLALKRFETLISKSNQKAIFKNRIHTTSGQIALEQIMDTDDIASVTTFNSSYAKEYAEKRINEEKKRDNIAFIGNDDA